MTNERTNKPLSISMRLKIPIEKKIYDLFKNNKKFEKGQTVFKQYVLTLINKDIDFSQDDDVISKHLEEVAFYNKKETMFEYSPSKINQNKESDFVEKPIFKDDISPPTPSKNKFNTDGLC